MPILLKILRALALTLLGFLFFALFEGFIFTTAVRENFVNASFYKSVLMDANVYERVYTEVLPEIDSADSFYGDLQIPKEDAIAILRQVFPPEFLQEATERDLDNAEAYFKSDTDDLELRIDLRPAKARVPGAVVDFLNRRIDTAPACTPQNSYDANTLQANLQRGIIPTCVPQGFDRAQIKALAGPALTPYVQQSLSKAPDAWDPVEQMSQDRSESRAEFLAHFDKTRSYVGWATGAGHTLLILALIVIVALSAFLRWGDWKGMARGVGVMLFTAALPALIFALIFRSAAPDRIHASISEAGGLSPAALTAIADVMVLAAKRIASSLLVIPVIVVIIGALLFALSFFISRGRKQPKASAKAVSSREHL